MGVDVKNRDLNYVKEKREKSLKKNPSLVRGPAGLGGKKSSTIFFFHFFFSSSHILHAHIHTSSRIKSEKDSTSNFYVMFKTEKKKNFGTKFPVVLKVKMGIDDIKPNNNKSSDSKDGKFRVSKERWKSDILKKEIK